MAQAAATHMTANTGHDAEAGKVPNKGAMMPPSRQSNSQAAKAFFCSVPLKSSASATCHEAGDLSKGSPRHVNEGKAHVQAQSA